MQTFRKWKIIGNLLEAAGVVGAVAGLILRMTETVAERAGMWIIIAGLIVLTAGIFVRRYADLRTKGCWDRQWFGGDLDEADCRAMKDGEAKLFVIRKRGEDVLYVVLRRGEEWAIAETGPDETGYCELEEESFAGWYPERSMRPGERAAVLRAVLEQLDGKTGYRFGPSRDEEEERAAQEGAEERPERERTQENETDEEKRP